MIEINSLDDVMNYFAWIIATYIALFLVIIINFFKVLFLNKKSTLKDNKPVIVIDLIVDVICGLAMFCGLMFMGVLADNNAPNWAYWNKWLWFISATSFTIFIINIIIVMANKKSF